MTWHYITVHDILSHCITLHCYLHTLHALHSVTLRCITFLYYIPLHCRHHAHIYTKAKTKHTNKPTKTPANRATKQPTEQPSNQATKQPSNQATKQPSNQATKHQATKQPTHAHLSFHPLRTSATGLVGKIGSQTSPIPQMEALESSTDWGADTKCGAPAMWIDTGKVGLPSRLDMYIHTHMCVICVYIYMTYIYIYAYIYIHM